MDGLVHGILLLSLRLEHGALRQGSGGYRLIGKDRGLPAPQTQGIGHHAHGTETHGSGGQHGIQGQVHGRIQDTGGHGDADGVIKEGPEQVLLNVPQHGAGEVHGGGDVQQAALHQHHIRRLDGDVRTGADGKAHIGLRQRRGIVDAVAHHGHPLPLLLELGHALGLILRQHLSDDLIHADLAGDGVGGALVVAGQQHHSAAHATQSSNGLGTVGLHHICHGHATQQTAALGEEQGRFAVLGQPVSVGLHGRQ